MPDAIKDQRGFEAFYERHYRLVYRICYTYMKKRAGGGGLHRGRFCQGSFGRIRLSG